MTFVVIAKNYSYSSCYLFYFFIFNLVNSIFNVFGTDDIFNGSTRIRGGKCPLIMALAWIKKLNLKRYEDMSRNSQYGALVSFIHMFSYATNVIEGILYIEEGLYSK
jgi:hypothetical protein